MTKDEINKVFAEYGRYAEGKDYALINAIAKAVAPQRQWVGLTDEQIDKEFEAYAAQFDTFGDEWQDMGAGDYFKAGFKAAHGIKGEA